MPPETSCLAQERIDDEAAAIVFAAAAQVCQDLLIGATGFFQGIGEDSEAGVIERASREGPIVVGGLGELGDDPALPGKPGRRETARTKRVSKEIPENRNHTPLLVTVQVFYYKDS
jgi:hypothetical protein